MPSAHLAPDSAPGWCGYYLFDSDEAEEPSVVLTRRAKSVNKRRSRICLVLVALAAAITPAAADEQGRWVYFPSLDAWVEATDAAGVLEAEPKPPFSADTPAPLVPEVADEPPPAPQAPAIQVVDCKSEAGACAPPFSSRWTLTTVFTVGDGDVETVIWAGVDSDNRSLLIRQTDSWQTGRETGKRVRVPLRGALVLTGFSGSSVRFRGADGATGSYDWSSEKLFLD